MRLLLPALLLATTATAAPVVIKVTSYATPLESDFGDKATQTVRWRIDGHKTFHESLFVPGFVSRDSDDPKHPGINGAGMEGCGWIDPALHKGDAALSAALAKGYRVLTLDRWVEKTKTAVFVLTKHPIGGGDGAPLVEGESASVREGNKAFPMGRWVRLYKDGKPFGARRLHDDCSSCETDYHIDLYRRLDDGSITEGRWEAELLPAGFKPEKK